MAIAIIDFGMGNLRSVEKAFHHIGAEDAFVTSDPQRIAAADKAVLPGDGAFDTTVDSLRLTGTDRIIGEFIASGRPFLGICIGMQVLLGRSEEGRPAVAGLNLVPGVVKRFQATNPAARLAVPQIGWNLMRPRGHARLLAGLGAEAWVYFLHSYYCVPDDAAVIAGEASYGTDYCAVIESGNLFATQFHPEKSGDAGLLILKNFVAIA